MATATREIRRLGGAGILTERDLAELNSANLRVLHLMSDGEWHDARDIRLAAGSHGVEASEGLRRMRELRRFFEVERLRAGEGRVFQYRLVFPSQQVREGVRQQTLPFRDPE